MSTVLTLVAGLLVGLMTATPASANPSPVAAPTANTVTADALPTVQVDGVVWAQAITGNTVYAGGSFANARPAGAAAGTNLTPRSNLLSYDLTTGALNTSFAPSLNAQAKAVAVSPDGSRVYVGGQFTAADGANRYRIAAYSTATGTLLASFAPSLDATVNAIVATNSTVYVGGLFNTANGNARNRLAAFNASNGALLTWNPSADSIVQAMVATPDGSKIIVGGAFQNVSGQPAYGLAAVDALSGTLLPWNATTVVRDAGTQSSIMSLATDGNAIYGSGYVFGSGGNLEGTFSADPSTGNINWIEDCHGDTYGVYANGGVVYDVSHAHYCGNIGGFPQTDPQPKWTFHHAMAFTAQATGTVGHDPKGYFDFYGNPSPSIINWFPDLTTGTVTGQSQAAWTITGNANYVVLGGEFPSVNGAAQQGLVRFVRKPTAPSKQGPMVSGGNFKPTLVPLGSGTVRVSWQANWDRDDKTLTYKVIRNENVGAPAYTTTADSTFWNRPTLGFVDSGLTPGVSYRYRLYVSDPSGNQVAGDTMAITAPSAGSMSGYGKKVIKDGAGSYWPLNESSGSVFYDNNGFNDLDAQSGVARGAPGAITGDAATTFDGTSNGTSATRTAITGPNTFSLSVWVRTTSTSGGKIIGFGDAQIGSSNSYDRHLYLDNQGKVWFGVYNNQVSTLTSSASVNDGQWHQIVAGMGSGGMSLYVDGARVAQRSDVTGGQDYSGYWRIGGDNLNGWPSSNGLTSNYLAGDIDEVAVFPSVLSRQTVQDEYVASGRTLAIQPAPRDAYGAAVYNDDPDLYWRLGEASGTTATDSSRYGNTGDYSGGVTLGVSGAIKGTPDTAAQFDGNGGVAVSSVAVNNPTTYSEEAWFKTTTTSGGKIIGFGDQRSGTSGNYDRHIYMQDDGRLVFGVYAGQANVITTSAALNDGSWHQVIGAQSADGMKLYVDGVLVGTNPQTQAQPYTGYWRVGGDTTWGSSSPWFAGTIDDVAVYSTALSAAQVTNHWNLGSTTVAANKPPTAAFSASKTDLKVSVNASASTDSDGTVASYAWNFGDGATATGALAQHSYATAGTYTITLTVTDDKGATDVLAKQVSVVSPNVPPSAAFTATAADLTVTVDGSTSADTDGSVAAWAWDFGDGTTDTGSSVSHAYAKAGTYVVKLTVTDDRGATDSITKSLTVAAANVPPTAAFTSTTTNLAVSVDGSTSSDPDGTVAGYAWTFGDGGTASTKTASHAYAAAGTYSVKLTVTDNRGATNTTTQSIKVSAANASPTASFTAAATALRMSVDASASSDPDGTVTGYGWDFGDGGTATGKTAEHTYAAAGTYTTTLKVTDNQGATGSLSKSVTVTATPGTGVYAADSFGRTASNGWGTADTGGAWTVAGGAGLFSVGGGSGRITLNAPGAGPTALLGAVSQADVVSVVDTSLNKPATGNGVIVALIARHSGNSDYRLKERFMSDGTMHLILSKVVGGTETTLREIVVAGLTYTPGDVLRVRFQVKGTGTTSISGKVWKVGGTEAAAAQVSATDSEGMLQAAGSIGLQSYLSGSSTNAPLVTTCDNLSVTAS